MELPFDKAELRQPVRPALPPGLRELAEAERLTDSEVKQLAEAYLTIRGPKPKALDEWRPLWRAIKTFLEDANGNQRK